MRNPPLDVVVTWPQPNYDNPEHRGPTLLIVEITIASVAILTLLARLYVRIYKVNKSGLDDWLMLAAMVFGIGVTVCVILASQLYGWNIHVWDLRLAQAETGRKVSLAAQTLFLCSSGLAKNSILVSYLRIAPVHSWLRRLTYATIFLVTALIFIFIIVVWSQCKPTSAYWDLFGTNKCNPEGPPALAQAITTVITDLIVCALPLHTLLHLKLPMSQRIALMCVFSLGLVVVFAASMRAYYTHYVTEETYDVTWEGFHLWIWTAVEANLGVICGSIPALRPLFRNMFRSKSSSYYNNPSRAYPPGSRPGVVTTISSSKKHSRVWADGLQRGSKGVRIQDEVDIEEGFEDEIRHQPSSDSGVSSLEMDTWPPKPQPRYWPGK
ncbi:integral membrane protein [Fusarium heterosporum]|uniref:Integral membrane protein n=1 Tax=Fusarium heterosporum TaxID=42747 RepID=A0A8H5TAU6_FUSHE|nr:integral membrane protein [Fusarium heterosporum]